MILRLEHFVRGWLEGVALAGIQLPQLASETLGTPPLYAPEVYLWAVPRQSNLRASIGLTDLPHEIEHQRTTPIFQLALDGTQVTSLDDAMLAWLQRTLLDDGVTDAEDRAIEFLERATNRRIDDPWV